MPGLVSGAGRRARTGRWARCRRVGRQSFL